MTTIGRIFKEGEMGLFGYALTQNTTLTSIDLSGRDNGFKETIQQKEVISLFEHLAHNNILTDITLYGTLNFELIH